MSSVDFWVCPLTDLSLGEGRGIPDWRNAGVRIHPALASYLGELSYAGHGNGWPEAWLKKEDAKFLADSIRNGLVRLSEQTTEGRVNGKIEKDLEAVEKLLEMLDNGGVKITRLLSHPEGHSHYSMP